MNTTFMGARSSDYWCLLAAKSALVLHTCYACSVAFVCFGWMPGLVGLWAFP